VGAGAIGLLLAGFAAHAALVQEPIFISIGGGAVDSAAFRWSSALAQILSRPPGLPNCEAGVPCGIPGVIAGAQTYDHPDALLSAIAEGRVATGILSAMRILDARCAAPKSQPPAPIRVLKALYRQPLQLVVPSSSPIRTAKDLSGATVAVDERGSDSDIATTALLDAYGPYKRKVKIVRLPPGQAAAAMKNGAAQAAIFVGHSADGPIGELIGGGGFTLLAMPDSPERRRMLRALPVFEPDAVPGGTYPSLPTVATVSERAFWVAGPALDSAAAEELVANESASRNAARLAELVDPISPVADGEAFSRLPAQPAEGAQRFAAKARLPVDVVDCPATVGPASVGSK
jgi:TRAP transporter TAXI family solute receptor